MSELSFLSIKTLQDGLREKRYSSVEVTKTIFEEIKKRSSLNCFISLCEESALREAAVADSRRAQGDTSPLLGVPIAIKDNILTKGVKTTAGSKILANFVAPYDATVTKKLRDAGAVVVGKANQDEFAMGSSSETSTFGPVRNPWNEEFVPGGSSGGSASAVAAGLSYAALGTDTGGSIRQPASLCGIVGMKPTYGRVSRYGVIAYASSLDQVGPFTRSVHDCALLTEVLSGEDPYDSTSVVRPVPRFTEGLSGSIKGLRIGIPREYFIAGLDPEVENGVREAIKVFEKAGAQIVEISLPHTELALAVYYVLAPAEASSNLARYDGVRYGHRTSEAGSLEDLYTKSRSEGFGAEVQRRILVGSYVLSAGYYDAYYLKAQKVRTLIARDFKEAFSHHCDVIVCPTAPSPAFKLGEKTEDPLSMYLSDVFTIPVNLAGLPGMSIPCGFSKSGLPIGLQLIGKPWDEETLFKAAFHYESLTNWHTQHPVAKSIS